MICALVLVIASCKKNADKKPDCKIVTLTDVYNTTTTIYNVSYNNDGKISTLTTGSSLSVFTYAGNTIIINKTNGGSFSERDSVTVDNNGKALNIRQYYDQAATNWDNTIYDYDGNGDLLKSEETSSSSSTPQTTLFTVTNGNLVSIQTPTYTTTLEYFTDKQAQAGDYLGVVGLVNYGVDLYPHRNMGKSVTSGTTVTNLNYDVNTDGLVSKLTATSGSTIESIAYQYQCN